MIHNSELPIFPTWELNGQNNPEMTGTGLTKREYIAALLMPAMLHRFGRDQAFTEAAADAVGAADKLLSVLET